MRPNARLKHPNWLLKKMIKEDHLLACTTRMFEILLGSVARTASVHRSFRTHTLAAVRLFTCQRASLLQTPLATFVTVVAWLTVAREGAESYRPLARCQPPVAKIPAVDSERNFRPFKTGPSRGGWMSWCCRSQQAADIVRIRPVQTTGLRHQP
jgi:hypothetical protein